MQSYVYGLESFAALIGTIDVEVLTSLVLISSIERTLQGITRFGNDVSFEFKNSLSNAEKDVLDAIVASYGGETYDALASAKASAKHRIDEVAGEARSAYISSGVGQEAVYLRKEREARDFIAGGYLPADIDKYPIIKAEADALGLTYSQLADQVVVKADLWAGVAGAIEAIRIGKKAEIDAAETLNSVNDIVYAAIKEFKAL